MASLSEIKSRLLKIEAGKFQRLCDDWLHRKGFENINPIGMMRNADRPVKGTPDCLLMRDDGKYTFSEYTVQQDRLAKKLEEDIKKCFDEVKTGIPVNKVSEIIICYVGKLTTKEIGRLRSICSDRGVLLTLNGLDSISLSIKNSHPVLSETYLDLPLDTGQLLSVQDFIARYGRSNFTTSIDNQLLFRDELMEDAKRILESSNFLLVSGAPGLGKTSFSVNLAKKLQREGRDLNVICLFDKGADLIRDITAYFSEPGDYLILIDDANRLDNRLDYILHYLNEGDKSRTFRIVATVRDYARGQVIEKVEKYTRLHELVIGPLTDGQINELSQKLFGIKNGEYQKRIQEVACGNPRLAIMASKVAIEKNHIQSIQNVTSLYNDYFGGNENVKQVIEDKRLVLAACAISFFRKIDKLNEQQMSRVEASFGVQSEEFWEIVDVLHKKEIVDLYENEVVKISDQILSTYLFYIAVFEKKIVRFSSIVNDFYPEYTRTIVDSLNPVISAFDQKRIISDIRSEVKDIFEELSKKNEGVDASIEFLSTFWFALPTESLVFVKNLIEGMDAPEIDWRKESFEESKDDYDKSSLISLLRSFRYYGEQEFQISFELLLKYLVKEKSSIGLVIRALLEHYSFKSDDWRRGYFVQVHIVDALIGLMDRGNNYLFSRLFMLVANSYLKTEFSEHKWLRGDSINIINFRLPLSDDLLSLRERIIKSMSLLAENPELNSFVGDFFKNYVARIRYEGRDMVEADLPLLQRNFISTLDRDNVSHCMAMQDYCDYLESLGIAFPHSWKVDFYNETVKLANFILEDRYERRALGMGYEEYNQHRHKEMVSYFSGMSRGAFVAFIERCKELYEALSGSDREHALKNGLEMSLRALAEAARGIYPELVSEYLEYDDFFEINPYFVVGSLLELLSSDDVLSLLTKKSYRWKKLWLSSYFAQLPEACIDRSHSEQLVTHISNTPSNELHTWLDYLDRYKKVDPDIYRKVVGVLVAKSKEDMIYARPLDRLFRDRSGFEESLQELLPDWDLIFDAYLAAFNLDRYFDYSGDILQLLLNRRFDFLYRVIDIVYEKERWPDLHTVMPSLNFLWERENYIREIEGYAKYVQSKEKNSYTYGENIFNKLFFKENGKDELKEVAVRKYNFLRESISNNANDIGYICLIFNAAKYLDKEALKELLGVFIRFNSNFEDFQALNYEITTRIWSGSRVPILEREMSFLLSLLPLFNSIDFLKHKAYIESQIEDKLASIEYEKKRDYLESR